MTTNVEEPATTACGLLETLAPSTPAQRDVCRDTLLRVLGNILEHPEDAKYRTLKMGNELLRQRLLSVPGVREVLLSLGFKSTGEAFVLPAGRDLALIGAMRDLLRLESAGGMAAAGPNHPPAAVTPVSAPAVAVAAAIPAAAPTAVPEAVPAAPEVNSSAVPIPGACGSFGPEADPQAFLLGAILGHGSYGSVRECWRRSSSPGEHLAVKVLDLNRVLFGNRDPERARRKLDRETRILQQLSHINIVRLAKDGIVWTHDTLYIVMERMSGDLFKVLKDFGRLVEHSAKNIFRQLVAGLQYIHDEAIIHRDLKPENVLTVEPVRNPEVPFTVKITDFGCSKSVDHSIAISREGTSQYMAPEVQNKLPHDKSADFWSLGVLVYVMVEGAYPFQKTAHSENAENFGYQRRSSTSQEVRDLVRQLLRVVPEQRLTLEECLRHSWMQT